MPESMKVSNPITTSIEEIAKEHDNVYIVDIGLDTVDNR